YRKAEELQAPQRTAGAVAANAKGGVVDVTDERAVAQFVQTLLTSHGKLDCLVNTVGGFAGGAKLWETDPNVLEQMLSVNLRAGHALLRAVVPAMLKLRRGAIVNVAS